jgi:hypothetical protein
MTVVMQNNLYIQGQLPDDKHLFHLQPPLLQMQGVSGLSRILYRRLSWEKEASSVGNGEKSVATCRILTGITGLPSTYVADAYFYDGTGAKTGAIPPVRLVESVVVNEKKWRGIEDNIWFGFDSSQRRTRQTRAWGFPTIKGFGTSKHKCT